MSLLKVVHLIQYSNKKINFRKIKLILDLENWHPKLKNAIFWQPSIKRFYKKSKTPLRMFIWMQKSIEFHLPHYESLQLSSCYSRPISNTSWKEFLELVFWYVLKEPSVQVILMVNGQVPPKSLHNMSIDQEWSSILYL